MANGGDRVHGSPKGRALPGAGLSAGGELPPLEASDRNPADHPIAPDRGLVNLHPAILAAKGDALRRIRAYQLPLAQIDGVLVYLCPQCHSNSSDPGFAVWHNRSTCMEVALA